MRPTAAFVVGLVAGAVTAISLFAMGTLSILTGGLIFVAAIVLIPPRFFAASGMLVGLGATWLIAAMWAVVGCQPGSYEAPDVTPFLVLALAALVVGLALLAIGLARRSRSS